MDFGSPASTLLQQSSLATVCHDQLLCDFPADPMINLMQKMDVIEACGRSLGDMLFRCQFSVQKYAKIVHDIAWLSVNESNLK